MMAAALVGFAVVSLIAVAIRELSELPCRRRIVTAPQSRPPAPAPSGKLR